MKPSESGHINASTKRTLDLLSYTLISLLGSKSLEKITITDICTISEVPRATFYNHFDDKYDLLRYSLKNIAEDIYTIPLVGLSEDEKMLAYINQLLDFSEKHYKLLKKISSANCNSILFDEIKKRFYVDLLNYIEHLKSVGHTFAIDANILAEFYSNAIVYSSKTWLEHDMSTPREKVADSMMFLFHMACS